MRVAAALRQPRSAPPTRPCEQRGKAVVHLAHTPRFARGMLLEQRDQSLAFGATLERLEFALRIGLEDRRMDIALAAHRRGVAELAGHFGHRFGHLALAPMRGVRLPAA